MDERRSRTVLQKSDAEARLVPNGQCGEREQTKQRLSEGVSFLLLSNLEGS